MPWSYPITGVASWTGLSRCSDALPAIVHAVGSRLSVMMDGGVRRGAHVVKALALGAQAVLIGRATLYGDAPRAKPAPCALLRFSATAVRTMQLCGVRSVAEITRDLVRRCSGAAS